MYTIYIYIYIYIQYIYIYIYKLCIHIICTNYIYKLHVQIIYLFIYCDACLLGPAKLANDMITIVIMTIVIIVIIVVITIVKMIVIVIVILLNITYYNDTATATASLLVPAELDAVSLPTGSLGILDPAAGQDHLLNGRSSPEIYS